MKKFIYGTYVCGIIILILCAICNVISPSTVSLVFIGIAIAVTFLFVGGYPLEHIHFETKDTLRNRQRQKENPMLWRLLAIWALPLLIGMIISYMLELCM